MAHLKKSGDGHLMKTATGHLSKGCSGGTPWPPDCHSCNPPLPDTVYVTFTDLAGDFAAFEGQTALTWRTGCIWEAGSEEYCADIDDNMWVGIVLWSPEGSGVTQWYVHIGHQSATFRPPAVYGCYKSWELDAEACDPSGSYNGQYCEDSAGDCQCSDSDSCEDSTGATCEVSLSP